MKKLLILLVILVLITSFLSAKYSFDQKTTTVLSAKTQPSYWFLLHRRSNQEFLYSGTPGEINQSQLVKIFQVKTGIPKKRPTPLPQLVGQEYWLITNKVEVKDNPETAPYFLTLNIPTLEKEPFGPIPYNECSGQCNWILPGNFGLHGVGGNLDKLSPQDLGSSGCIRHLDQDITYLYNLLDLKKDPIRYYIKDV